MNLSRTLSLSGYWMSRRELEVWKEMPRGDGMSCQLAVCPLHQKMVRRHLLVKKEHLSLETRCPDRKMCKRRDGDGRNAHRNYVMAGGGEVWVLQEWINSPQYKSLPVAFLCSWRQTKANQALCMEPYQLSFPLKGKRQCYPSYLPKISLKLSFFQLLCIILGCPKQVFHFLLAAALSIFSLWLTLTCLSCWANAKLHHNLLSWSPNKMFLAPQIVFQV